MDHRFGLGAVANKQPEPIAVGKAKEMGEIAQSCVELNDETERNYRLIERLTDRISAIIRSSPETTRGDTPTHPRESQMGRFVADQAYRLHQQNDAISDLIDRIVL
jgi:hypothetical protein